MENRTWFFPLAPPPITHHPPPITHRTAKNEQNVRVNLRVVVIFFYILSLIFVCVCDLFEEKLCSYRSV